MVQTFALETYWKTEKDHRKKSVDESTQNISLEVFTKRENMVLFLMT